MKTKHEVENSRVYMMDCMEGMKHYPDKFFDIAIVDPPYGIGIAEWDSHVPTKEYWDELFRISKNQIVFGGNYHELPHTEAWVCWDKTFNDDIKGGKLTKGGCPRDRMSDFELIWTSFDHKSKMLRFTQIGNLIGFGTKIKVYYDHKSKIHPTQKAVNLYDWFIKEYAQDCETILDTHVGSGSSRIAAHKAGLDFVGFEIDENYFKASVERFNKYRSQLTLF